MFPALVAEAESTSKTGEDRWRGYDRMLSESFPLFLIYACVCVLFHIS